MHRSIDTSLQRKVCNIKYGKENVFLIFHESMQAPCLKQNSVPILRNNLASPGGDKSIKIKKIKTEFLMTCIINFGGGGFTCNCLC